MLKAKAKGDESFVYNGMTPLQKHPRSNGLKRLIKNYFKYFFNLFTIII